MPLDDKGQQAIAAILAAQNVTRPINNKFVALAEAGNKAEATELLLKQANPANQNWHDNISAFIQLQREKSKADEIAAGEAYAFSSNLLIIFTIGGLGLGILVSILISRSIIVQIGCEPVYAMGIAASIAKGDLTTDIKLDSRQQDSLIYAIKTMRDNIVAIVSEVRNGTTSIDTASREIATGNMDLSSRTETQASSLQETAASLEELTSTVRQNSDNARQTNQLAHTASAIAETGGRKVTEVVNNMNAISEASQKIVSIISVIDSIAFQTNILALNAAVEAARAGEQGRGFAVVASEVRNLAQKSATAAKEIKDLITDTTQKVALGSQLVDEAGVKISEVIDSVRRVSAVINEISTASSEQTTGIDQINHAVAQMDEVTQQNASLVEEAAAAASAMQDQARELTKMVDKFKLVEIVQAAVGSLHPASARAKPTQKITRITMAA